MQARGRYVTFVDADDLILPNKFASQVEFMQHYDYAISHTNYRRLSEDGKRQGILLRQPKVVSYRTLLWQTALGTLTPMIDRDQTGYDLAFDETLATSEDYYFWLTLTKRGFSSHRLDQDLARYRRGHPSITAGNNQGQARQVWHLLRQQTGHGTIGTLPHFVSYALHALWKRRSF
jgi:teichuronic acid biosynthesis glycosyltransferase TuaG